MKKRYKILIPVVIIIGFICFFEVKGFLERKRIIGNEINETIVSINNNWTRGRSYDYITKSNYKITLINNDTLSIGDSISKKANNNKYDIFRKKEGSYYFLRSYYVGK